MKALTICQPYAELIIRGDKLVENRTWPTTYRGPLWIHAGKSRMWLDDDICPTAGLVFGAIVGLARLVDVQHFDKLPKAWQVRAHVHGPFCWLLEDVQRLTTPYTIAGTQGLWTVDGFLDARLRELLPTP